MDLTPLIAAFGVIAVAELGDKTQLAAITLSSRYRAISVFVGAMLAVTLVDGVSILAGVALADVIPMQLVGLFGAVIFIGFGIYTLYSKDEEKIETKKGKSAALTAFSLISMMELGDKTQIAIIAIAAKYGSPLLVLSGTIFAFAILMGIGILIGSRLMKLVPQRYMRIFTGALFLFFGAIFLLDAAGIALF